MSVRLTTSTPRATGAKRGGKYDRWLDGAIWAIGPADVPWFAGNGRNEFRRIRRALSARARTLGFRLVAQWGDDGALLAQAVTRDEKRTDDTVLRQQRSLVASAS